MNIALMLVLVYLLPLVLIQIGILVKHDSLTEMEKADLTTLSCLPILNMLVLIIAIGFTSNCLLSEKE